MTDRPIIFSAPMVRALLDGRKTQTRRMLKPQPEIRGHVSFGTILPAQRCVSYRANIEAGTLRLPYAPGDRLWVREAHAYVPYTAYLHSEGVEMTAHGGTYEAAIYREGFDRSQGGIRWRPSIHMPRWASRLTLTVTDVRVHRLQEISEVDAKAEGIRHSYTLLHADNWQDYRQPAGAWLSDPRSSFRTLWNSIHGPDAWDANPWVVALTFDVHRCNIDQAERQ